MKKKVFLLIRLLVLALLVLPVASCEDVDSSSDVTPEVSVPDGYENYFIEDLSFGHSADEGKVAFQINVDWTMKVVASDGNLVSWCSVDPTSGGAGLHKVMVRVSENDTYEPRSAKIHLMCGSSKVAEISVSQESESTLLLTDKKYSVSHETTIIDVELNANVDYNYSIDDASWVHELQSTSRALTTHKLTFEVDENIYSFSREAHISFYNTEYELHETLIIVQAGNPHGIGLVPEGFYVCGEATGSKDITDVYGMAVGVNEVTAKKRSGMYEKYIVLEEGKDFSLVLYENGTITRYGAELAEYNITEYADHPYLATVKRGELATGDNAPSMKVGKTGLYHIVLDLNLYGDLKYPQIVVAEVQWGVSGAMNGWGFTEFEDVEMNAQTMTWKMENVRMPANGEFKFAYGHGWKIQFDDAGNVKAYTTLGEGALPNGTNIMVETYGVYTITLTYTLNGSDIAKSFDYTVECTQLSSMPETMYIIGNDFGNWDWNSETVVEMTPVHSHSGHFWAIRHMTTATEFKFCALREWAGGDFIGLGNDQGYYIYNDNRCKVATDGIYMIYVDFENGRVIVEPANVYGIGDCFGGWDSYMNTSLFTVGEDNKTLVSPATVADGHIRMYAAAPSVIGFVDWWQMEFIVYDGTIEYRGTGGDQEIVSATDGQRITLDFNAGTGFIR